MSSNMGSPIMEHMLFPEEGERYLGLIVRQPGKYGTHTAWKEAQDGRWGMFTEPDLEFRDGKAEYIAKGPVEVYGLAVFDTAEIGTGRLLFWVSNHTGNVVMWAGSSLLLKLD